ncbi:DUF1648 domain-containing protein [Myroides sp. LJL119]
MTRLTCTSAVPKPVYLLYFTAVGIFLVSCILTIVNYSNVNSTVIIHWNSNVQPDGYGHKSFLWFFLGFTLLFLAIIILFLKRPNYANYPVKITLENKEKAYRAMRYFLALCALFMSLVCFYSIWTNL